MGTARPHYPLLTVGDRRAPLDGPLAYALQQPLVAGYAPNGAGGTPRFTAALVTGRDHRGAAVEKLGLPLIFELAHRQWPDAGFDYFLAAMREPTSDRYYPSLLFSLEPIDRRTARAPLAPSWTARERGLALLRAEESPEYWESPAPAVAMRLGAAQVGGTPDSLGLLGFYAFGRPLYLNRQCAVGDAGLDPAWSASAKSAAVVLVNGQEPRATPTVTTRESFTPLVKVLVASGTGVNASGFGQGLDQTRGLLLTREYLLDMTRLQGSWDATYLWTVHGLGMPSVDKPELWKPAPELADLYAPLADTKAFEATEKSADPLVGPKALPWSVRLVQGCPVDAKTTVMGAAWYDRRIGVAVRMLPEPGTTVFTAKTPPIRGRDGKEIADEFGGTTLIAKRKTGATAFVALHEPFQGEPRIAAFTKFGEFAVQPNPYTRELQAIGTIVTGRADSPVNDRVFLQFKTDKPVSIAEQAPPAGAVPEHITFADYAYIRIGKATVDAVGDIRALRVRVAGTPKLMLNGQPAEATVVNGVLEYTGK